MASFIIERELSLLLETDSLPHFQFNLNPLNSASGDNSVNVKVVAIILFVIKSV